MNREITLRPVSDSDMEMLTDWLNKKRILEWFSDAEGWLREISERNCAVSRTKYFMVLEWDIPFGFCQYYDCYYAKENLYGAENPNEIFSLDYLIGEDAYLGKGYGKLIVEVLTEAIKESESSGRVAVKPDKGNVASKKVFLANGYVYDEEKGYYYKSL